MEAAETAEADDHHPGACVLVDVRSSSRDFSESRFQSCSCSRSYNSRGSRSPEAYHCRPLLRRRCHVLEASCLSQPQQALPGLSCSSQQAPHVQTLIHLRDGDGVRATG